MGNMVRVFNDNTHPLDTIFKGEKVYIDAKDYWRDKKGTEKVMDIYEANDFHKQYHPVPTDGSGKMVNDSKHYKILRLDPVDGTEIARVNESAGSRCMAPGCKHVSASPEELETHAKVKHASVERLSLPEQDEVIEKKSKSKN